MARKISSPTLVEASGTGRKRIEEFVGLVNTGSPTLSIARMHSGEGWSEPGQRPDFDEYTLVPEPRDRGPIQVSYRLDELAPYIDWTRFFLARGLKGHYPGILDDRIEGSMAERLLDEARALLRRAQADGLLAVKAVCGFFPASSEGDDILLWADEGRESLRARVPCLRQASVEGARGLCIADWLAPTGSGLHDWIGAYAVTAGLGLDASVTAMAARNDGYDATMLALLADRIAQAAAEKMHEDARKTWWGYAPGESLPSYSLFRRGYRGMRASPGKAPCPDPRERRLIFQILEGPRRTGMRLDEACALIPSASACGWYFSHPEAAPFAVGRIGREEASRYAIRRGESLEETEGWLRNELGYTPPSTAAADHKEGA